MHTVLISKYPKRTLEEIRKLRGLTTAEAALKVGITKEDYEKIEKDGVIWDTDIIMNFNEMRMAVQLDRSFKEDALKIKPDFSTPYFITRLI